MSDDTMTPIHPGEHLAEFLEELGVTEYRLAKEIHVPPRRINEIVKGRRGVTADTALRLAQYFSTSPEFWMHLQDKYELERARQAGGREIGRRIRPLAAG